MQISARQKPKKEEEEVQIHRDFVSDCLKTGLPQGEKKVAEVSC